jgi:hypothetical protein
MVFANVHLMEARGWFSQNRRAGFQVAKWNRQERKARKVF